MFQGKAYLDLPQPDVTGAAAVEELMARRRSVRDFADRPLTQAELGQLLWAAQGITGPDGRRTAPSAGALYPLELYAVVGDVEGLPAGIYHYLPDGHRLQRTGEGDLRRPLAAAALNQDWLAQAPVAIVFTAVYERTGRKYGDRAARYVHMEAGHAGQNLFLQAGALGLATVVVGAFEDDRVAELLNLPRGSRPLSIMPVGRP